LLLYTDTVKFCKISSLYQFLLLQYRQAALFWWRKSRREL